MYLISSCYNTRAKENHRKVEILLFHINPVNTQLNSICHLLALLGAHHILHVSRIRVKHTR